MAEDEGAAVEADQAAPGEADRAADAAPPAFPARTADEARRDRRALAWIAVVVAIGIVIAQAFLVFTLLDTNRELTSLRAEFGAVGDRLSVVERGVGDVQGALGDVEAGVGSVGDRIDALEALSGLQPVSSGPGASVESEVAASPAPALEVDGPALPRFDGNVGADPAIGTVISELGGLEYYGGQDVLYDLADGKARAILVWAHWCPYCQEELPEVDAWHEANADAFENMDLISITTAIDPSAGNPLFPYLDESGFTFPVLVDSSGALAAQLGVNAFPFWVFTGPDGAVVGRVAGLLGPGQFVDLFTQLDALAAG